ncbi:hypothetical protein PCASD_21280 [Puccinia coronata f. sp. avenae]|uniref:Uncharacterized protein n=1 Tax=Puccinia coronata f. sp. avenae TaxID=200324 RepID=A0A2N5TX07_9BASI|nr:hypothetical protein PCASD_21280 [Puccinia coronata f. sp. avenae]
MNTPHNLLSSCAAIWHWHQSQQQEPTNPIYTRAKRNDIARLSMLRNRMASQEADHKL